MAPCECTSIETYSPNKPGKYSTSEKYNIRSKLPLSEEVN